MNKTFPFDEVEGLLCPEDKETLRELASWCAEVPGVFVEIGSLKGLSALCITEGAPNKTLICYESEPSHEEMFRLNVRGRPVLLEPGDFRNTLPILKEKIAFAFVDHDHEFETTKIAFDLIWSRLSVLGRIAFHDYEHPAYPGGTEFLKSLSYPSNVSGNIIVFQKKKYD